MTSFERAVKALRTRITSGGLYLSPGNRDKLLADVDAIEAAAVIEPAPSGASVSTIDPAVLAEAYEAVMAMAPDPRPTETRWETIVGFYDRLIAERERVAEPEPCRRDGRRAWCLTHAAKMPRHWNECEGVGRW